MALSNKDKKSKQPKWGGIAGREGIVNTNHDNCWVCEERRYILFTWDRENISERWGDPISDELDIRRIRKKYLPHG